MSPPLTLVIAPPMSWGRLLRILIAGFASVVALVLLAAYLGYRGSDSIQDAAQALTREHLVATGRGALLEQRIESATQQLIDRLAWVLGLCFMVAAALACLTVLVIRRAFAKLEWQTEELARVSWHMLDAQEKMARRFSHEMHDELGQSLSGLRRILGSVQDGRFNSVRGECIGIVDEVIQSVRKLSQLLRPVILDDFGLDSGLRWLCERFTQRTQIPADYVSNFSGRLAEAVETHLFRITQEALTNIARHSGATHASIALSVDESVVRLIISDNGHGLPPKTETRSPSLGMVGMRARARQIHGELIVENQKEGGLRLHVEAPVRKDDPNVEREDAGLVG